MRFIIDKLNMHALKQPDAIAYHFLDNNQDETITYAQLYQRSSILAERLQKNHEPGERVLLLLPPGLDYIIGFLACLQAGLIAVPCYPPLNQRFANTLCYIAENCQPCCLLTTTALSIYLRTLSLRQSSSVFKYFYDHFMSAIEIDDTLPKIPHLCVHHFRAKKKSSLSHTISDEDIAFLQYSSGTTGKPKGIMVSQANLSCNLTAIQEGFQADQSSKCYIWLPPYHDMGLIGGILFPLFMGFPVYLCSPINFVRHPLSWLENISKYKITISGGPNFSYALCNKLSSDDIPKNLDLSSWKVAFCGAEVIQEKVMQAFVDKFSPYGFSDDAFLFCYGLAETTLYATGELAALKRQHITIDKQKLTQHRVELVTNDSPNATNLLTSGKTHSKQKLVIADINTNKPLDDQNIGKIMLQSDCVTKGYWQQPELTQKIYQQKIAGYSGTFLDTGDLGAIVNGQLLVTGRLKNLIVIHGLNYSANVIENNIEQCSALICNAGVAVLQIENIDNEGLIALIEVDAELKRNEYMTLANCIRECVFSNHTLLINQCYFVNKHTVIKTTSGKISHQACINAINDQSLEYFYHWQFSAHKDVNHQQKKLRLHYQQASSDLLYQHIDKIVTQEIKQYYAANHLPEKHSLQQLDSMQLLALLAAIEKRLHHFVSLSVLDVYAHSTIEGFVEHLEKCLQHSLNDKTLLPTSTNQQLSLQEKTFLELTAQKSSRAYISVYCQLYFDFSHFADETRAFLNNIDGLKDYRISNDTATLVYQLDDAVRSTKQPAFTSDVVIEEYIQQQISLCLEQDPAPLLIIEKCEFADKCLIIFIANEAFCDGFALYQLIKQYQAFIKNQTPINLSVTAYQDYRQHKLAQQQTTQYQQMITCFKHQIPENIPPLFTRKNTDNESTITSTIELSTTQEKQLRYIAEQAGTNMVFVFNQIYERWLRQISDKSQLYYHMMTHGRSPEQYHLLGSFSENRLIISEHPYELKQLKPMISQQLKAQQLICYNDLLDAYPQLKNIQSNFNFIAGEVIPNDYFSLPKVSYKQMVGDNICLSFIVFYMPSKMAYITLRGHGNYFTKESLDQLKMTLKTEIEAATSNPNTTIKR